MSTRARLEDLADQLSTSTGVSVYAEPGAPGRGDLYAYLEPPSYVYEAAVLGYCPNGRAPRLDTSIVVVGTGTAPGQLSALYDAADVFVGLVSSLVNWAASGDATPGDYQGTPAYVLPVRST